MKENEVLVKILNMSKIITGLLIVILVVLIIGVSKMDNVGEENTNSSNEEVEYNTNYDVSMFEEIEASALKSSTKGKTQVVYIGRESCGWCAAFLPNLWDAQDEYDFTTLYIDIAKIIDFSNGDIIDQESYDILNKLTGEGYETYMEENFGSTPMILIIKDNKIIGGQTGYSEYDGFKKTLEEAGL